MTGELALTVRELRDMLSHHCELEGGQTAWARKHHVSVSQVSDALRGKRDLSASMICAMGLMPVTRYVPVRRGA